MRSAYFSKITSSAEDSRVAPETQRAGPVALHDRFVAWHASLPAVSRNRPFAMLELEQALRTQGKYLSPVLLALGWTRRRRWTGGGQYPRYWVPPDA